MRRRCGLLLLTGLCVWSAGCAGTARREDGSPIYGPRAWAEPPAPAQRVVALTAVRSGVVADPSAPKPEGLARYFPGLRRGSSEAPKVAARYRPTWFGLRPSSSPPATPASLGTQTYVTDARQQLNRSAPEPTVLPVALQVPSERASSDRRVTPTTAEGPPDDQPLPPNWAIDRMVRPTSGSASPATPAPSLDLGGKPAAPGEDEVNPLPPATEPAPGQVAEGTAGTPPVPSVEPPAARPVAEPSASTPPPAEASPASNSPTTQATQATSPAPVKPTSARVLASPQGEAPEPTLMVGPSPQAGAPTAKTWKRPCFRRLVRKVGKLGEYANPPTAAPH